MAALLARAFSLGGGTYTGIEAVSNGLPILREPRAQTGRRTMTYMALSLAVTATGLLVCYLLVDVRPQEGKTLNAVLAGAVFGDGAGGRALVIATLASEGALLVAAAQAGFLDGPRVLANMAHDGWVPRRFSTLSERLTTQNGILLMGGASFAALAYTGGDVRHLVVMYSINVFLTFSLSMLGMLGAAVRRRRGGRIALFGIAFLLCATILGVTVFEKFEEGGWITLAVTGLLAGSCFLTRRHYDGVARQLRKLDKALAHLPEPATGNPPRVNHRQPTAAILVGGFNGLGVETVKHVVHTFGHSMKNLVFISVGAIDSGTFKGEAEVEALRATTESTVHKYEDLAHRLGHPAAGRYSVGTDPVEELDRLCRSVAETFPHVTFFAGQLAFSRERWYDRVLHNHTTLALQKRLLEAGLTVVILPRMVERGSRARA
ncbi:MAG: amino acid permease, partial [Deltaproteobacteria bacterium]|nr:amino acid permease [Deltaproteobacteria bacterium]